MRDQAAQVVVALSGGMDSCVCAALAVRDFGADATAALHVSYGQRTEGREQAAFQAICDRLADSPTSQRSERRSFVPLEAPP